MAQQNRTSAGTGIQTALIIIQPYVIDYSVDLQKALKRLPGYTQTDMRDSMDSSILYRITASVFHNHSPFPCYIHQHKLAEPTLKAANGVGYFPARDCNQVKRYIFQLVYLYAKQKLLTWRQLY